MQCGNWIVKNASESRECNYWEKKLKLFYLSPNAVSILNDWKKTLFVIYFHIISFFGLENTQQYFFSEKYSFGGSCENLRLVIFIIVFWDLWMNLNITVWII